MLTTDDLKSWLTYREDTGQFFRKVSAGPNAPAGKLAGRKCRDGYIQISVLGKLYMAHRLVWLWQYGKMPDGQIDHINGDTGDNRISNLRIASPSQNSINQKLRSNNRSGHKGVLFVRGRWQASITVRRKRRILGAYPTINEAIAARRAAEKIDHAGFVRQG